MWLSASPLITCAINTSRTLLPCDFTLVDFGGIFEYWYSYYEHSYEFKIPRSKGNIHVEREKKCRRALEWVGVFKGPAGF